MFFMLHYFKKPEIKPPRPQITFQNVKDSKNKCQNAYHVKRVQENMDSVI
jgi:hypothetical protein